MTSNFQFVNANTLAPAPATGAGVAMSMLPEDAVSGGGFSGEGKIGRIRFIMYSWPDKNGRPTAKKPQPTAKVEIIYLKDGKPVIYAHHISCGDSQYSEPAADGLELLSKGSQRGLNNSTNMFKFNKVVFGKPENGGFGFPNPARPAGIASLEGAIFDWILVPKPRTGTLIRRNDDGTPKEPKDDLLPAKVLAYPGQASNHPLAGVTYEQALANTPNAGGSNGAAGVASAPVQQFPPVPQMQAFPAVVPAGAFPGSPMLSASVAVPTPVPSAPSAPVPAPLPASSASPVASADQATVNDLRVKLGQIIQSNGGVLPVGEVQKRMIPVLSADPARMPQLFPLVMDINFVAQSPYWSFDGQTLRLNA